MANPVKQETAPTLSPPSEKTGGPGLLGVVMVLVFLLPVIALLGVIFTLGKQGGPGHFYQAGGYLMHAISLLGAALLAFSGYVFAYIWKRKPVFVGLVAAPLVTLVLLLLAGLLGTRIQLRQIIASLQEGEAFQLAQLLAHSLAGAFHAENYAWAFVAFFSSVMAFLFGFLGLRNAHTARQWWRGGIALIVVLAVFFGAFAINQTYELHFLQFFAAVLCFLALSMALVAHHPAVTDTTIDTSTAWSTSFLVVGFAMSGLITSGLSADCFFFSSFANAIDSATMGQNPALLASYFPLYPRIWSFFYLSVAGGVALSCWLVLSNRPLVHVTSRWLMLALFCVLIAGVLTFRSHNRSILAGHCRHMIHQNQKNVAHFVSGLRRAPWTPSLHKLIFSSPYTRSIDVSRLHHLLVVTMNPGPPLGGLSLELRKKGIYAYRQLAVSLDQRKPGAMPSQKTQKVNPTMLPGLYAKLAKVSNRRLALGKQFAESLVNISVHPTLAFQTIAATLYTAHQAGFSRYAFVLAQHHLFQIGRQTNAQIEAFHSFPFRLSLSLPKGQNARTKRFRFVLELNQQGAALFGIQSARPTNTLNPGRPKNALPPAKIAKKLLWQEKRTKALTMQGLRKILDAQWKTASQGQRRILIKVTPKVPYHELLGAFYACKSHKDAPSLWLAPTNRNIITWGR